MKPLRHLLLAGIVLATFYLDSSISAQTLRYGDRVSLQSHHGRFLVASPEGDLDADRTEPLEWETFTLEPPPSGAAGPLRFGDRVVLRSTHGLLVAAEDWGGANADRSQVENWEIWTLVDPLRSGQTGHPVQVRQVIALRSHHGTYLVAEDDGRANADRSELGNWETWRVGREWTDFYYDRAAACAPGECCPCPYRGRFDGANCFVARPPVGRRAEIREGRFTYPRGGAACPLGEIAGDQCRVGKNPWAPLPFLYKGGFYLASLCTPDGALRTRVERVGHRKVRGRYPQWEQNGVPRGIRRRTLVGGVFGPPRDETRRVALLLAGQQFWDGYSNALTGQPTAYLDHWNLREAARPFVLDGDSLARRLLGDRILRPEDSVLAVAFDPRFNHKFNRRNKDRIEEAYYRWLRERFDPERVEFVYLAGFSRGGCLALRLARRLRAEVPQVPVVAQSFDGVCNRHQGEMGVTVPGRVRNPVATDPSAYAWPTDLRRQFAAPERSLAVLHHVGGHAFLTGDLWVRAFSQKNANEPELDLCWFRQRWFDQEHESFRRNGSVQPALTHLVESLDRFAAAGTCPPVGRCVKKEWVLAPFECNDLTPADCATQSECAPTTECRRASGSLTCRDLDSQSVCGRYDDWCRWRRGACRKKALVLKPFECNDLFPADCAAEGDCRVENRCRRTRGEGPLTCSDLFFQEQCKRYDRWCDWR